LVRRFDDPAQAIHVAAGETFAIALASNPTTGYTWQAEVDPRCLALLAQEFEPGGDAIGAGGLEVFRFHVRQAGQAEITFEYRRPWGGGARETERFRLVVAQKDRPTTNRPMR
jgi:inhibitor of cysteine peptidase